MYAVSQGSNRSNGSTGQSFLEMLSSGPSRSPSPVRAIILDQEDLNNPVPTNWGFQHRPGDVSAYHDRSTTRLKLWSYRLISRFKLWLLLIYCSFLIVVIIGWLFVWKCGSFDINKYHRSFVIPNFSILVLFVQLQEEETSSRVEAMLSPRNSLLVPRRFYSETDGPPDVPNPTDLGLKTLTKHINGLKKKIKKYEEEFEENFGYRPSHSDKMSNRDIKRLCAELNKLRKEHKLLKEDPIGALLANANSRLNNSGGPTNNNNGPEKTRAELIEDMVKDVDRKLCEKRLKSNRSDNMEELSYEQLLEEKTAVQKGLLHIEGAFGRPVSKEDRTMVRPLYDRYRTLKRLLIRAGAVSPVTIYSYLISLKYAISPCEYLVFIKT